MARTKSGIHRVAKETEHEQPIESRRRFVCVHGHFYQPPRENPWLETVEIQDSAAPYHDWNDRITAECYAPNGASRIVDNDNLIIRIVNNYARMSFNFGPTLLSWLQDKAPRTYRMIIDADRTSRQRYNGHGSAMGQVYNHIIMPLANRRDALTQIRWGIADFEHRFGRKPEGMWLSETAVNSETLDLLAQEGILFTILAPHQCARTRAIPADGSAPGDWIPTVEAAVDTTRAYSVPLPEGRSIAVFFYDGPVSRAVAFEGLLNSGENFGSRLLAPLPEFFPGESAPARLSHIATDGESYGHHHKHGEMALSYAMHWIEESKRARLTNYGEFLNFFPPQWQAQIVEDTAWSCSHGIERWRSNCGCSSGRPGWNQEWRTHLREAFDFLRDATAPLSEKLASGLLKDLWVARDAYIHVILNRDRATEFLNLHASRYLNPTDRIAALELLELQRHTQLMYTSCGWFFDEVSGIETVQVIAYAGRVLQLAAKLFGPAGAALEEQFLAIMEKAKSNIPEIGTGADVYRTYVSSMKIDLEAVGAHYAISSMFRNYPEDGELFCFDLHRDSQEIFSSGRGRVAVGRALIRSRVTEEAETICFAVLHLGDQNLSAAVKRYSPNDPKEIEAFNKFSTDIGLAIRRANLPEVIRLIDRFFGPHRAGDPDTGPTGTTGYSLTSLFADEQHRILKTILNQTLSEMEDSLRKIYEDHASLMHFLTESGMSAPPALALAASFAINASLRRALEIEDFDPVEIENLLQRAEADQIALDVPLLSYNAGQRMKRAMVRLEQAAAGEVPAAPLLANALIVATTLQNMPFEVNAWQAQNIWNDLLRRSDKRYWSEEWKEQFKQLGLALGIAVDRLVTEEGVTAF